MKTINCNACRKKITQETREEYLKGQYAIYHDLSQTFACFCTAAVLISFIRRGRTKKYIQEIYNELVMIYDTPQVFGKEIKLTDVIKKLEIEYGIDWKRMNVHIETESQFIRGQR